jgi:hypothetical protein
MTLNESVVQEPLKHLVGSEQKSIFDLPGLTVLVQVVQIHSVLEQIALFIFSTRLVCILLDVVALGPDQLVNENGLARIIRADHTDVPIIHMALHQPFQKGQLLEIFI